MINIIRGQTKGFVNKYTIEDNIVKIQLHNIKYGDFEALIDVDELPKLFDLNLHWNAAYNKNVDNFYVTASKYITGSDGKRHCKTILLHKVILNADVVKDQYINHKNHNTLDNRKENLEIIKNNENLKNRKSKNKNNRSGYRNVFWNTQRSKWVVVLQINGKQVTLGEFDYEAVDKAGELAERMREKYYGEFKGNN